MGDKMQTDDGSAKTGSALQSGDHGQLLDVIDRLRASGIDRHVPLPQLVVCGDQSSGKSSVLEAVSGVHFPTKDTLCTRFATELILRHSVSPNIDIQIRPSHDRPDDEKTKLLAFKAPKGDIDQFPSLVEAAKEVIGIDAHAKRFSEDVLRVELSGPHQPNLTLVDLPGLFHSGSKQQSSDEAKLVKSLVQRYMKNERSIILAVVSAKNDYANQIVTDLARKVDPKGSRTMGIITKPDTLIPGSDSEMSFLNLAKNEDVAFRLGWHVLRNRDFNTRDYATEQRDQEEKDFLSQGVWTLLPANMLGIDPLKPRLSNVLREQITSVLPNLIEDVERGINDCNVRLDRLGDIRETLQEQRQYLVRISQRFSALVKSAVDGIYGDEYFGDPTTPIGESKRLRAVIQDLLLRFAKDLHLNGQQQKIINEVDEAANGDIGRTIQHSDYLDHVHDLMRKTRGRELPGTFNPLIIGDLFFEQSRPWKALTNRYCRDVLNAIKTSLEYTIDTITDSKTAEGLLKELLYPAMMTRTSHLHTKVSEVLEPYHSGHAITYNHYFTETIQKARKEHHEKEHAKRVRAFFGAQPNDSSIYIDDQVDFSKLVESLDISSEADMDRFACSEATYCMIAYYKVSEYTKSCGDSGHSVRTWELILVQVAMKVFVDNFSVLAVEKCMLSDLAHVLSPDLVMRLGDDLLNAIAAESESSMLERQRTTEKLKTLQGGLVNLNRFNRLRSAGTSAHSSLVKYSLTSLRGYGQTMRGNFQRRHIER